MAKSLDVYLHKLNVGKLHQDDSGRLSFSYDTTYLQDKNARAISISMPLKETSFDERVVKPYFSGILPDDQVRARLAKFLGLSEKNPFSLLEAIGGECAGALSIVSDGEILAEEKPEDIEILTDEKLLKILDLLKSRPLLAGKDNIRLSLAGAQDKIAVGFLENKVCLIHGMTPTTHILKTPITDIPDSVHNEFFCLHLAKKMKIKAPLAFVGWIGSVPYLMIERYDRIKNSSGHIQRIHQEDFCQALSVMPDMKYEKEGGPSIHQSLKLIENHSETPAADQLDLLRRVIFNFLIGNCDAHGKNFSFIYESRQPKIAPAYDLLCTAVYPNLANTMAMKIGKKYNPEDVYLRHWHELVPETKAAVQNLDRLLLLFTDEIRNKTTELIKELKDQNIKSQIFEKIEKVIIQRSNRIKGYFS